MSDAPLLALCVPTYNRADHLRRLLDRLDAELPAAGDTTVLIADNRSTDGSWELLQEAAATRPWLQVHRHDANLGAVGNLRWLIEHAPPCDYLWCCGDDDLVTPGSLRTIVSALRTERPAWLFLPHIFVTGDGREVQRSPAPAVLERFADSGELYRHYHHWLTFLTASILRRDAYQEAAANVHTDNEYIPLLWFFRAGLGGPCMVLPTHAVSASQEVSWADRAHVIVTLHFTRLWDDGLKEALTEEQFGETLDGLYREGWGQDLWRRHPIEELMRVVARFPQSRGLRGFLWAMAVEQRRRDAVAVLDEATRATGDDQRAAELVRIGEELHAGGDVAGAARHFAAATQLAPVDVMAWNDLAVVHHALGTPEAERCLQIALFVDPDDEDAQANLAALTGA